jgi:replicative DNA helicase
MEQVDLAKLTEVQVRETFEAALADEAAAPVMTDDELVTVLVPQLQKRMRDKLTDDLSMASGLGNTDDVNKLASRLLDVESLGEAQTKEVYGSLAALRELPSGVTDRLPTYVPDLDVPLSGGFERGSYVLYVAATGAGKSFSCLHTACVAALHGYRTMLVSTELAVNKQYTRMLSYLTNTPYDIVLHNRTEAEDTVERMGLPHPILVDVGGEPNVEHILKVAAEASREYGKIEVLVIDHLDDVTEHMAAATGRKDASTYQTFKAICTRLHKYAVREDIWIVTASQAKGQQQKFRQNVIQPPTNQDASESLYKTRKADYMLGMAVDPTTGDYFMSIGKNRNGPAGSAQFKHALDVSRIHFGAAETAITAWRMRNASPDEAGVDEFSE